MKFQIRRFIGFKIVIFRISRDKTNGITVAPREHSTQTGHLLKSSLCAIWVAKDHSFFVRTVKTLVRLCGCAG